MKSENAITCRCCKAVIKGALGSRRVICEDCRKNQCRNYDHCVTLRREAWQCQFCGSKDNQQKSFHRFCSKKCREKSRPAEAMSRKCVNCGNQCRSLGNVRFSEFCSDKCRIEKWTRQCEDCNCLFVCKYDKAKKCKRCQKRKRNREASIRLRVRKEKAKTAVTPISVRALWERDRGKCRICGKKIDWDLEWPHKMSMSVDHIIPLSRGGTDNEDNVRSAHLSCNSRRGNKGEIQRMLFQ